MSNRAATEADKRPGLDQCMALLVEQQLRGLCIKLAVSIHHGAEQPTLLAEISEMAGDAWALRDGSDDS